MKPYDWPDEPEKEKLTKVERAMKCERCGEPLWQEHLEHDNSLSYTWDAGFENSDLCSYCNHMMTKDD